MAVIGLLLVALAYVSYRRVAFEPARLPTDLRAEASAYFKDHPPSEQGPSLTERFKDAVLGSGTQNSREQQGVDPLLTQAPVQNAIAQQARLNSSVASNQQPPVVQPRQHLPLNEKHAQVDSQDPMVIDMGTPASADQLGLGQSQSIPFTQPVEPRKIPAQDSSQSIVEPDSDFLSIEIGEAASPADIDQLTGPNSNAGQTESGDVPEMVLQGDVSESSEPRAKTHSPAAQLISTSNNETQRIVTFNNDTFWSVSQRAYGSGIYYKALIEFNKEQVKNPGRLPAGTVIIAPPISTLESLFPALINKNKDINQTTFNSIADFHPEEVLSEETLLDAHPETFDTKPEPLIVPPDARQVMVPDLLKADESAFSESEDVQTDSLPVESSMQHHEPSPQSTNVAVPAEGVPETVVSVGTEDAPVRTAEFGPRLYQIKPNENLFGIARNELLQASRYLEILELNRARLPVNTNHLSPLPAGMVIEIPQD
jgi:nucleoid-associated protein YgaU